MQENSIHGLIFWRLQSPDQVYNEYRYFRTTQNLVHDLIIVWLVADNIVSDEAIAFLEIDDFCDELLHFDLLDVDIDDKKLQDSFTLDVFDKMLLAFLKLRTNMLWVSDLKVVLFYVDQWFDLQTVVRYLKVTSLVSVTDKVHSIELLLRVFLYDFT